MIVKINEDLKKYTTMKIGGMAKRMVVPETKEELVEVVLKENPKYCIGGGSNLLISEKEFDLVLDLRCFNEEFINLGQGHYIVGSSVRLQRLITKINEDGYGGIEYLFSVPGLVGGAVVMNAGRGVNYQKSISDYLVSVEVLKDGKVERYSKDECLFGYRNSIFKNTDMIILSAEFQFEEQCKEVSEKLKNERIALCKKKQDNSAPNMGSVFCECNRKIMSLMRIMNIGKGNVRFSRKTNNWLLNTGNGTFEDACWTIEQVQRIHKLFKKKCFLEIIIWK